MHATFCPHTGVPPSSIGAAMSQVSSVPVAVQ